MPKERVLKINKLFELGGIKKEGEIIVNYNTYDFDPSNPQSSWLYGALLAFIKLKKNNFRPKKFVTIGTGSGLDSIMASEIFDLDEIYQTDIHPNVIQIAENNTKKFITNKTKIKTLLGNLCEPILKENIKSQLVYANIPNIPSSEPVFDGKTSSSKFSEFAISKDLESVYAKWLLLLQYKFLENAKNILLPDGIILISIGDRMDISILKSMFESLGYRSEELVNLYKIQTEALEVVTGYAEQELKENIEFDFYDHDKIVNIQDKLNLSDSSVSNIKNSLVPYKLTANQALNKVKLGGNVGHIYTVFKLKLK